MPVSCNSCVHRICEAFLKADNHIFKVHKQKVKLSECIDESNMQHYTQLTDHVFHQILLSTDKQLKKVSIDNCSYNNPW